MQAFLLFLRNWGFRILVVLIAIVVILLAIRSCTPTAPTQPATGNMAEKAAANATQKVAEFEDRNAAATIYAELALALGTQPPTATPLPINTLPAPTDTPVPTWTYTPYPTWTPVPTTVPPTPDFQATISVAIASAMPPTPTQVAFVPPTPDVIATWRALQTQNAPAPVVQPPAPVYVLPAPVVQPPAPAVPVLVKTVEFTCEGDTRSFAEGAVLFRSTVWHQNQADYDCHYDVIYDPGQSGYFGVKPMGWWFQPWLPGPHREYHEVALIAKPGLNWFLGPECTVYFNNTGTDATALKNGVKILERANRRVDLNLTATAGMDNETWLFVTCNESDASGFSISLIDPVP